ncbi:FAD/NAD(P)-binding protein [Oxalobacteraceae bacterium]|nr:FAD/NAD(P)-binding protein [Oxalobacteraceae bacterium]
MKRNSVTIIGMGPRGLSVLERLAALLQRLPLALDIRVIEPGDCGQGAHAASQPQHLLINTVASQVTLFPTPGTVRDAPVCATPSLTEWARQHGYRRVGQRYLRVMSNVGAVISDADYLPRCLLGEYLGWVYQQLAAGLPDCATLRQHRQRAVDLWRQPDGRCAVELDNGFIELSDFVFLTTGHGHNAATEQETRLSAFARAHAARNPQLAYVRQVYPLDNLAGIAAGTRVAVQGLGLSAHDVVAELTVGRGGVFEGEGGALRYRPSGKEPLLILFSRNCLPNVARGVNQKGLGGRHRPHYFTVDAIAALREQALRERGSRQLDFERELLPLLLRDMGLVYRGARDGRMPDPARYVLSVADGVLLDRLLFPLRGRRFAALADFRAYLDDYLRSDLAEAELGNVISAVKGATDVLRDVRASLQAAVEHGGLTPESHRHFLEVFHPAINRVSFGPPRRRNQEWLALLACGVATLASGPGASVECDEAAASFVLETPFLSGPLRAHFDVLLSARLDAYSPQTDVSPLSRNLLRRGLVRPYLNGNYHPGGIDIDADSHPLDASGLPLATLWVLGYPVEGAHYYTHALPRPLMASRQVRDADRCVSAMFAAMASQQAIETHPHGAPISSGGTLSQS